MHWLPMQIPARSILGTLMLAAAAGGVGAQPIQSLGVAGDSLSNEYYEFSWYNSNSWPQLLAGLRGVDLGPTAAQVGLADWGDFRGYGFQNNYSRGGATTDALVDERGPEFLAEAVRTRGVSHVVIAASGNDMASWNYFAYVAMYDGVWSQHRKDAWADASVANVRQAVQTVHASGAKVVLLNMPDFGVMPFYSTYYPDPAKRRRITEVVVRVNAGLRQLAHEFQIPLVDLYALDAAVFGDTDQPKQTLDIGGVTVQLRAPNAVNTDPLAGFLADGIHLTTLMQGVWANAIITALNAGYHTGIPLLGEQELLGAAGVASASAEEGRVTQQIGPYARYVVVGPCAADFNASGVLDVQDIFDFVNAWMMSDPRADVDASGTLTAADIFAYLNAWMGGC